MTQCQSPNICYGIYHITTCNSQIMNKYTLFLSLSLSACLSVCLYVCLSLPPCQLFWSWVRFWTRTPTHSEWCNHSPVFSAYTTVLLRHIWHCSVLSHRLFSICKLWLPHWNLLRKILNTLLFTQFIKYCSGCKLILHCL